MEASRDMDNQTDLHVIADDVDDESVPVEEEAFDVGGTAGGHGDLVADVIRATGLLDPEKLDVVRRSAGGSSFSQALVEEGFASALGVARRLAEQYHLPLVDLAVAGVDATSAKSIALPVLERVCAIPFSSEARP